MISMEYRKAFAETLDILEHINKEDVNKISKKFIQYLIQNASSQYKSKLDFSKRIIDMNLNRKTIGVLALINQTYWCNEEQKIFFERKLRQNQNVYENELRKKYNIDNLFKKK